MIILVVYLGHGDFSSGIITVLSFIPKQKTGFCLREVLSSQIEEHLRKNAVHLYYRTTRQSCSIFSFRAMPAAVTHMLLK